VNSPSFEIYESFILSDWYLCLSLYLDIIGMHNCLCNCYGWSYVKYKALPTYYYLDISSREFASSNIRFWFKDSSTLRMDLLDNTVKDRYDVDEYLMQFKRILSNQYPVFLSLVLRRSDSLLTQSLSWKLVTISPQCDVVKLDLDSQI